jgi:hypothetical protein
MWSVLKSRENELVDYMDRNKHKGDDQLIGSIVLSIDQPPDRSQIFSKRPCSRGVLFLGRIAQPLALICGK